MWKLNRRGVNYYHKTYIIFKLQLTSCYLRERIDTVLIIFQNEMCIRFDKDKCPCTKTFRTNYYYYFALKMIRATDSDEQLITIHLIHLYLICVRYYFPNWSVKLNSGEIYTSSLLLQKWRTSIHVHCSFK